MCDQETEKNKVNKKVESVAIVQGGPTLLIPALFIKVCLNWRPATVIGPHPETRSGMRIKTPLTWVGNCNLVIQTNLKPFNNITII